jgi:hypothetical protein
LLTPLWWAIAPAYSATPKQTLPQIRITPLNPTPLPQIRITPPNPTPLPTNSLTGSLLPGGRIIYRLMGTARQNLTISLTSDQLNAMFTLVAPDGTILASSRTGWIGSLQSTGNYQIIVSNTSSTSISNYSIRYAFQ